MPVTPLGVFYPAGTDGYDLTVDLAAMATSVDGAIGTAESNITSVREIQTYKWADATARAAETGMTAGDTGYQSDTDTTYHYSGSAWVAQFDDTGWVTLPLTAGWTGETNNIPQFRRLNGVVYIRGRAAHSSGMTGVIANLPSGSRPGTSGGATDPSILQIDATTLARVAVRIDGGVNLFTNTSTNFVSFGGIPPFIAA